MGGKSIEQQDLLIVLWDPEPEGVAKEIKQRFPYINVTYFSLRDASKILTNESHHSPKDLHPIHYVSTELLSSRQFDDLETRASRERLVGKLLTLSWWHGK